MLQRGGDHGRTLLPHHAVQGPGPRNPHNDRFILSKGHAAPILYAVWAEAGYLPEAELLNLRKISSDLDGHPVPKQAFTDVATGSLGQGLGAACGMAYTGKYFDKASYRVYCLLGDGELSEGSVWEAMAFASFYKLDNLVAILDVNRLGQSDPALCSTSWTSTRSAARPLAGTPSSWMDTAWRSCARPSARLSTSPQPSSPRPSKAAELQG